MIVRSIVSWPVRRLRVVLGVATIAMCASPGVRAVMAQGGSPPMPGMDAAAGASPRDDMHGMMAASLPVGIMIGRANSWMVGYQYMVETLSGLLEGTGGISQAEVLSRFATTPTDMRMQMHMGMLMYAPTGDLTVMAMLSDVQMSMGELHRDGTRSTERSGGIGDLELRGLYSLYHAKDLRHRILANVGIGVPTGSVNQRDAEGIRLEYPMQTGSGTFSLLPGVAYLGQALPWSWGAEFTATVRVGRNEHDYRFGNRYEPRLWFARQLTGAVSLSSGASGEVWETIRGTDSLLDATDEPTKDANRQGGNRLSATVALTVHPRGGFLKDTQFLLQGDAPVAESLDGPQLKQRYVLHASVQWGF